MGFWRSLPYKVMDKIKQRLTLIIHSVKEFDIEDWINIFFTLGLILVILAKPLSYFSDSLSIGLYLIGLIVLSLTLYVNKRTL